MKGWIYFASNDSLYGLLKIGFTERDPKLRILELSNTSVPTEFQLIYSAMLERADEVEQLLHKELEKYRVNMSREFFNCDHKQAQNYLHKILAERKISILYEEVNGIVNNGIVTITDLHAIKKEIILDIKNKFKEKKKYITNESKIDNLVDDEIYLLDVIETFTDKEHLNDYLNEIRLDKNYLNNIKKEKKIEFAKIYFENQIKLWWINYPNIQYQTVSSARNNSSNQNKLTINESSKFLEKKCSKCGSSNVFHSTGNFSYHCQNCNFRFG